MGVEATIGGTSPTGPALRTFGRGDLRSRTVSSLPGGRVFPSKAPLGCHLAPRYQAAAGIALGLAASRLSLTKLYAVATKYPASPVRSSPRYLVRRKPPTVFIQPKISSTRFLMRWLTA